METTEPTAPSQVAGKDPKALCPGCLTRTDQIAKSHAINDAFIKRIKERGQFLGLPSEVSKIKKMQNGGEGKLLCFDCESNFNRKYDQFAVRVFDRMIEQLTPQSSKVVKRRVDVENSDTFCRYISSVFWRAAWLNTDFYASFKLKKECVDDLYEVSTGATSPFRRFTFSLRQPRFKDEPLSHSFIMRPISYVGQTKRNVGIKEVQLMRCTILGVEVLAMHGKYPGKSRAVPGVIRRDQSSVFVPTFRWDTDPEYYRTMMIAMESDRKFGTPE